jgi:hypothetical protein
MYLDYFFVFIMASRAYSSVWHVSTYVLLHAKMQQSTRAASAFDSFCKRQLVSNSKSMHNIVITSALFELPHIDLLQFAYTFSSNEHNETVVQKRPLDQRHAMSVPMTRSPTNMTINSDADVGSSVKQVFDFVQFEFVDADVMQGCDRINCRRRLLRSMKRHVENFAEQQRRTSAE